MNDLIDRTIDFLERQHHAQLKNHPFSPEEIDRAVDTIFVGSIFFVEKFTRLLEQVIVDEGMQSGEMFVMLGGFEALSRRGPQYGKILGLNNSVTAYGADEVPDLVAGVQVVRIDPADNLNTARLTIYRNPEHNFSLVAMQTPRGSKDHPTGPSYRGFWAVRPSITSYVCEYLSKVVNPQYLGAEA